MSEQAVRLLQGYLWVPRELDWDPVLELPPALALDGVEAALLVDPIAPPFAFFDDGTPTATQRFYQVTALVLTERDARELHPWAAELEARLGPLLEATPAGVGWWLFEDLRAL
jgi:hypothetical protein